MIDDIRQRFAEYTKDTLQEVLGIEFLEVDNDHIVARMPVNNTTKQPFGVLHGGATVALAETVASMGTWLGIDHQKQTAMGLEINANHLRPVRSGFVTAEAKPIHRGRKTWVWDIRVTDDDGKLTAISRCTVAVVTRAETAASANPE